MKMDRYEIYDQAKPCKKAIADLHLLSFFKAFMPKQRNKHWIYLAQKQSKRAYRDSHKLEHLLDFNFAKEIKDESILPKETQGIYWDFQEQPIYVKIEEAFTLGYYEDGIFSIEAGKKAIFFYHEGGMWLFQKLGR